jgi:hypothetical protein
MWEMMLGWPRRRSNEWKRPERRSTVTMIALMAITPAIKYVPWPTSAEHLSSSPESI